jgi:hypothetical protein
MNVERTGKCLQQVNHIAKKIKITPLVSSNSSLQTWQPIHMYPLLTTWFIICIHIYQHFKNENRQHNEQKKKYKRTNNYLQNIHIKVNSGNTKPLKTGGELMCSAWLFVCNQDIQSIITRFWPHVYYLNRISHPYVSTFSKVIYYLQSGYTIHIFYFFSDMIHLL